MLNFLVPAAHAVDIAEKFGPAQYFSNFGSLVNVIVKNAIVIAGVVAFLAVIITGLKIINSAGDAKAQEQSKGTFTAAIAGLIIILGAYAIVQLLQSILGFDFHIL